MNHVQLVIRAAIFADLVLSTIPMVGDKIGYGDKIYRVKKRFCSVGENGFSKWLITVKEIKLKG